MATYSNGYDPPVEWWEHYPGSPEISHASDGPMWTREIRFKWGDLDLFRRVWLGYSEIGTATPTSRKYIKRRPPHSVLLLPESPTSPLLYASNIPRIVGLGADARGNPLKPKDSLDVALYKFGVATVVYRSHDFEVYRDDSPEVVATTGDLAGYPDEALLTRYVSVATDMAGTYATYSQGIMKWIDATRHPLPEGLPYFIPSGDVIITHYEVPAVPTRAIQRCMGAVNHAEFVTPEMTYPKETLLCQKPQLARYKNVLGQRVYDIRFVFLYLPNWDEDLQVAHGHNWRQKYVSSTGKLVWTEISSNGQTSGTKPFRTANFLDLFRPDYP